MKPDCYKFNTKNPVEDGGYVYDSGQYFNTPEDESTYSIKIEYDGQSSIITHFPERPGVKLVANDSPNECEGKKRVVFGLVCMKLLLSGELWVQDV